MERYALQDDHEIEINEQSESVECKERWGDNLKYTGGNYKRAFEYNFMNTNREDTKTSTGAVNRGCSIQIGVRREGEESEAVAE